MPNTLQVIPPALCFLPPVVAVVLAARVACSGSSHRSPVLSWLVISLLAVFESTAGIIGLNASTSPFALFRAELVVQTCLYALLGVSVLYLVYTYNNPIPWLPPSKWTGPCTLVLSLFLSCATILGLTAPFLSTIPPVVSPLVFLTFTLSTIPLLAHLIHIHCSNHPPNAVHPRLAEPYELPTTPTSMTSYASVSISPKVKPKPVGSASPTRLPNLNTAITVLIPPPLPSPASSSASFPSSSDQTYKPGTERKSHEDDHHPSGSSCSAVTVPSPKSAKVRDSACDIGMDADVPIQHPRGSRLSIRAKTTYIRMRARNILLLLLIAQLCASLSGTLLLVLGVIDLKPSSITRSTSLLRIIETTFTIICVCGFMQAFYLHAYRTEQDGVIIRSPDASSRQEMKQQDEEASVDMMPRDDDGDYPASPSQKSSKNLGIMKVPSPKAGPRKFKMFSGSDVSTTKKHQRFASASSSFSSPRPKRTPIIIFEPNTDTRGPSRGNRYSEVDDEGIELPILVNSGNAHLPSPPATPRIRDIESQWPQIQTQEEEVRVGVMRPEIRVKVVREMESSRYLEVAADVIDTASSEPGCSSHLVEDNTSTEKVEMRNPRVQFSCPISPPLPCMGPQSPTISFISPQFSMATPKSPTLSFMSNPTSRSTWKRAEKIRARLKRPLSTHLCPARSSSSDLVLEGRLSRNIQHRRTGSKIHEWYPFTSKASRREGGSREGDDYSADHAETADFVDLTDPFASPSPGYVLPKWVNSTVSDTGHSGVGCEDGGRTPREKQSTKIKAKDSPKVVDARNEDHGIWSDERCYLIGGGERPLMKSKSTSWGKLPMAADTKDQTTVADFPASLRSSAYVGCVSKPKPEMKKKERSPGFKGEGKAKRERGSPRYGKRPDSPFPMATKEDIESMPRDLRRTDSPMAFMENRIELSSSRSSSSLQASIRSKESPSSFKQLPTRLHSPEDADILDGIGGMSRRRPISQVIPQATTGEQGRNVKTEMLVESPVIKDVKGQPTRRKRNGSPVPLKSTPPRRKGSPIPIPFRSSPTSSNNARRLVGFPSSPVSIPMESPRSWKKSSESDKRRDSLRKQMEKEDILEEVLLAQRLLRRLDSAYDDYT